MFIVCVCVLWGGCLYDKACVVARGQLAEVSLPLSCKPQGLNSGCQAW